MARPDERDAPGPVTNFRSGTIEVRTFNDHIDVMHNLPAAPHDKALNIVGRAEVVFSIADFWKTWDEQARKDFSLALTYIAGEMLKTVPMKAELTDGST